VTGNRFGIVLREREDALALRGVRRGGAPPRLQDLERLGDEELGAYLDRYLARIADHGLFSGAVGIQRRSGAIYTRSAGQADREEGRELTLDTPLRIGSITKMFIAVAALQLVQEGTIGLHEPIARWVPEYPEHIASQVTVHHLLSHTSGIEMDNDAEFNRLVAESASLQEILAAHVARNEHLNSSNYEDFEPLDRHDYSNENYDLLGIILQRATGRGWTFVIAERVFEPAKMSSTGFASNAHRVDSIAVGYSLRGETPGTFVVGPRRRVEREISRTPRPAGSAFSTASDMIRFARALLDSRLLDEEHTELMLSTRAPAVEVPQFTRSYGYGAVIHEENGRTTVGHTGSTYGCSAVLEIDRDTGEIVVVLANFDGWTAQGAAHHIWELLRAE